MQILVTRFHLLLLTVTAAITGVGFFRIPADFVYVVHWQGNAADWLWPREALLIAPIIQLVLMALFFAVARLQSKSQYARTQHILDPALTLPLAVITATQLGLLLTGIGSDLDFVRFTGFALGLALIPLGVVLFEAERHTYGGLRMPWPIPSDQNWQTVHRTIGTAYGLAGLVLLALAWLDIGIGALIVAFAIALMSPIILAGIVTLAIRRR